MQAIIMIDEDTARSQRWPAPGWYATRDADGAVLVNGPHPTRTAAWNALGGEPVIVPPPTSRYKGRRTPW